jgi:hypothetical protein
VAVGVGLALEVALAALNPPYNSFWERFGPVFSDFLVFAGVLGEYLVGSRETSCQEELRERASDRLGKAEERAALAALETERLRERMAWRNVDVHTARALGEALSGLLNPDWRAPSVVFAHVSDAEEPRNFAEELGRIFRQAGWRVGFKACAFASSPAFGLRVPKQLTHDGSEQHAVGIRQAFEAVGLPFLTEDAPRAYMSTPSGDRAFPVFPPTVEIYVGPKPPLEP